MGVLEVYPGLWQLMPETGWLMRLNGATHPHVA